MYRKRSIQTLKTGEAMEIGVVLAPDEEHADRIAPFLKHKGDPWNAHIDRALREPLDELETRFYVGKLGGTIITSVMTVEHSRTGILGHVYTQPEHRRKGAFKLLMAEQMKDFRTRGGLLILGTGYDSPAYWIYHSFGFRSLTEGSGLMRTATEDDFEAHYFAPGKTRVVEVRWRDWPRLNALFCIREGDFLRSVERERYGVSSFEGGFLHLKKALEEDAAYQAKLLESEHGAVVGCATMTKDPRWHRDVWLLDLFLHPDFASSAGQLLDALNFPEGKIQCYADSGSPDKIRALEQAGFRQEVVFKRQIRTENGARLDVRGYTYSAGS
ncbi:MAG: GNAT family N-acetyltransferase [Candidatus Latescibacteria bacterium]|nr:GNAT family N-acetyltransferase [Candidatus Latescibacterota bacterium]